MLATLLTARLEAHLNSTRLCRYTCMLTRRDRADVTYMRVLLRRILLVMVVKRHIGCAGVVPLHGCAL